MIKFNPVSRNNQYLESLMMSRNSAINSAMKLTESTRSYLAILRLSHKIAKYFL